MEDLVEAAVANPARWDRLWRVLEPRLWDLVDRPRFASHLTHSEQNRRRIITTIRARLEGGQLRYYLDARRLHPGLSFTRWLHAFAKRTATSYTSVHEPSASLRRRSSAAVPRGSARARP